MSYLADWSMGWATQAFASGRSPSPREIAQRRSVLRSQLQMQASAECDFLTLSWLEISDPYSTIHESVTDGGKDTPRNAGELAALPDWRSPRPVGVDAPVPLQTTDEAQPNETISDPSIIAALSALAHSYLNSSRISLSLSNALDRAERSLKGSRQWFDWSSSADWANAVTVAHFAAARKVPVRLPAYASASKLASALCPVSFRGAYTLQLQDERRRLALIEDLYRTAALAGETGVIRFLRTDKIRWLRAGDSEDQPEWGESLLVSVSRRIEDLHKILGIDGMVQTLAGFTTYYVDHQLPDTVP